MEDTARAALDILEPPHFVRFISRKDAESSEFVGLVMHDLFLFSRWQGQGEEVEWVEIEG